MIDIETLHDTRMEWRSGHRTGMDIMLLQAPLVENSDATVADNSRQTTASDFIMSFIDQTYQASF